MIDFPKTAAFGKRIPFAILKKQGLAPRFVEFIKSLVWAYKLNPDTVQLAATEGIREIEVMDLTIKDKCSGARSLAAVISALDKIIPSPLIFRVFDEDGTPLKIAFNIKMSGGVPRGDSEVFRMFQSAVDAELPKGSLNLETFYKNFAAAVGSMTTTADESLRDLDARHYRREALKADIDEIDRKLAKEIRLDVKYRLMKDRQQLEKEMLKCQNSNT